MPSSVDRPLALGPRPCRTRRLSCHGPVPARGTGLRGGPGLAANGLCLPASGWSRGRPASHRADTRWRRRPGVARRREALALQATSHGSIPDARSTGNLTARRYRLRRPDVRALDGDPADGSLRRAPFGSTKRGAFCRGALRAPARTSVAPTATAGSQATVTRTTAPPASGPSTSTCTPATGQPRVTRLWSQLASSASAGSSS